MSIFPTIPAAAVNIDAAMSFLFEAMHEYSESDDPSEWRLGPDEYYEFLESVGVGHRRLRKYVREQRVGSSVTLTRAGVAMAIVWEGRQI